MNLNKLFLIISMFFVSYSFCMLKTGFEKEGPLQIDFINQMTREDLYNYIIDNNVLSKINRFQQRVGGRMVPQNISDLSNLSDEKVRNLVRFYRNEVKPTEERSCVIL